MADDSDDGDEGTAAEHLAEAQERLRDGRLELARTVRALRRRQRTPQQIRAVIDSAKRAVYKSVLLRRRYEQIGRVH